MAKRNRSSHSGGAKRGGSTPTRGRWRSGSPAKRAQAAVSPLERQAGALADITIEEFECDLSALDAECLASSIFLIIESQDMEREEYELGRALGDNLERRGDAVSLAALNALGAIAPPTLDKYLRVRASRLEKRGVEAPAWAQQVGHAEPLSAVLLVRSQWDDEASVAIEFAYPGEDETHSLLIVYDNNLCETASLVVAGPIAQTIELMLESSKTGVAGTETRCAEIGLDEAATRLLLALRDIPPSGESWDEPDLTEEDVEIAAEMFRLFALFESRVMRMKIDANFKGLEELSEDAQQQLVSEFLASSHAAPLRDRRWLPNFASMAVTFVSEETMGSATRWSPATIFAFADLSLLEELVVEPDEAHLVADALLAYSAFMTKRSGLGNDALSACREAIESVADTLQAELSDLAGWRPARRILLEMWRSGVDIEDESAVNDFMFEFNQRVARGEVEDW